MTAPELRPASRTLSMAAGSGVPPVGRRLFWAGVALACSLGAAAVAFAHDTERRVERHAAVGETVRVRGHVNFGRGCGTIPTNITVVQPPRHGTLAVRDETVQGGDPVFGAGCRDLWGNGKAVYYTRTSLGTDTFDYDSSSEHGVVHIFVTVD
jgi:hypothetical protein